MACRSEVEVDAEEVVERAGELVFQKNDDDDEGEKTLGADFFPEGEQEGKEEVKLQDEADKPPRADGAESVAGDEIG